MDCSQLLFSSQKDATIRGLVILWTTLATAAVPLNTIDIVLSGSTIQVVEGGKHTPIPPGSDNGLYNVDLMEGDIVRTKNIQRNAIADKNHTWPYGAIIYKVDETVGCPESPQCKILSKAMHHYHMKSCIRFKEWTGEDNYIRIFFNTENSGACWSPVGEVGEGEQKLSLGQRCWYFGIVVHELGHSIGFWHEMNRPDRDNWIYIYWSNIIEDFKSAFEIQDANTVDTLDEPFDYKSIMMYDEYAFSKDGKSPTLQAKTNEEIGPIWRKSGLSDSDIRRLKKLYHCKGNKPKRGFPYDEICDFNTHTCGFKNGHISSWYWKTVNKTDGYLYTTFEKAGTNPAELISINFHPVNFRYNRNSLGCIKLAYLVQGDGNSTLTLSQAYLQKVTQLETNPDATFELWTSDSETSNWTDVEIPFYITRPFKLNFLSQFDQSSSYGTIGIDNLQIFYSPCSEEKTTDTVPMTTDPTTISESETNPEIIDTPSIDSQEEEEEEEEESITDSQENPPTQTPAVINEFETSTDETTQFNEVTNEI